MPRMRASLTPTAVGLLALLAASVAAAQSTADPFAREVFPEQTAGGPELTLPSLAFRLENDREVPGPLAGRPLRPDAQGGIAVPLESGGLALVSDGGRGAVRLVADEVAPPADADPLAPVGEPGSRRRFRITTEGMLVAEKCRRSKKTRCHKIWKLRVPGGATVPPAATKGRLYVGALDNQVYALRSRNGHRIWATDVGRRVSNPLSLWEGELPLARRDGSRTEPRKIRLVLVLPEGGSRLLALEARSGRKVAIFELPDGEGRLVGSPLVTAEGTIAVARQRYTEREASLILLAVEVQEEVSRPERDGAPSSAPARP